MDFNERGLGGGWLVYGQPGVSGKLFGALGLANINVLVIAQGSSEMNISFVIHKKDHVQALNVLHAAFFPEV